MIRPWARVLARKSRSGQPSPKPPAGGGRRPGVRLRLEAVEDRTVTSAVALEPPAPPPPALVAPATTPGDAPPVIDLGAAVPAISTPAAVPVPPADGNLPAAAPSALSAPAAGNPPALTPAETKPADPAAPQPVPPIFRGPEIVPAERSQLDTDRIELPGPRPTRPETPAQPDGTSARKTSASAAVSLAVTEPSSAHPGRPAAQADSPAAPSGPAGPPAAAVKDSPVAVPRGAPAAQGARAAGRVGPAAADPAGPEAPGPVRPADLSAPRADARLAAELSDGALLGRFVADRDQSAFAALVQRHGSLVLGVCRQVLGDWGAAQDAFQNTFLILARKAGLLDRNSPLGGWLYKVAYRLALRSRATAARQRQTDQEAGTEWAARGAGDDPAGDVEQQELRQVLREELQRLPEEYRTPLLLCYFDGRTHADAAREIGLPRGSMAKRLGEGLEFLRERLLVRGFML
jgi:RNA polymerase sigma factor (sigma-70 family)